MRISKTEKRNGRIVWGFVFMVAALVSGCVPTNSVVKDSPVVSIVSKAPQESPGSIMMITPINPIESQQMRKELKAQADEDGRTPVYISKQLINQWVGLFGAPLADTWFEFISTSVVRYKSGDFGVSPAAKEKRVGYY